MSPETAILMTIHDAGYIVRRRRNPDCGGFYEVSARDLRNGHRWIVRSHDPHEAAKHLAAKLQRFEKK